MLSLDALLALVGPAKEADELRPRRPRHDWVRGEVQCLIRLRRNGGTRRCGVLLDI